MVRRLLEDSVCCVEAATGSEALRVLESDWPDCTLIDYRLPDYDGVTLLERIDTDRFPVVMLSGPGNEAAAAEAIKRGALDHLAKSDLTAESLTRSIRFCVDRKRTRDRAHAAESRYRNLFNEAPVMYVVTEDDQESSVIHDCNRLFTATLGYPRNDIIGKSLFDFYAEECRDTLDPTATLDILEVYSTPDECELRTKDGGFVPVIVHAVAERGADGRVRPRVMFIDISLRKEAEEALRQREAEMRTLLDAIPDVLIKLKEQRDEISFEPVRTETRLDNETPVLTAHTRLPEPAVREFRRHASLALEGGPPVQFDYELEVDGAARVFEGRLVRRSSNELVAIIRDETRKRELEHQLLQSQRLEAVGKLAGGVAHDFNNFLTVISGNAELALLDLDDDDSNVPIYREIVETSARAADLTRQLLAFSRQQILKPRVLDLSELVTRTEKMLRRLIGEDIEISAHLARNLPAIKADPGQVEQILMNLAVNARDAMPKGGTLTFETRIRELVQTEAGTDFTIPSGRYVRLTVKDNGAGMDAETRDRLFEPFFSTKERGKGTGLGLATVYGIVKQSGGYILVDSEPGRGTTFRVYFPCATEADHETTEMPLGALAEGNGESVIVLEDDPGLLALARSILERGGYRVTTFQNAEDAVRYVREDPRRVDLLATDVVMPGMSGPTVANEILALREDLPVLYISGYTDDARVRHGVLEAQMNLLEKPFSRAELLLAVRHALDTRR